MTSDAFLGTGGEPIRDLYKGLCLRHQGLHRGQCVHGGRRPARPRHQPAHRHLAGQDAGGPDQAPEGALDLRKLCRPL